MPSRRKTPQAGPIVEGLPAQAAPARFVPGCEQGKGEDCFVAVLEWERRLHQRGEAERDDEAGRRVHVATLQTPSPPDPAPAGRLLIDGEGATPDRPRALSLFERACDDALAAPCEQAAALSPDRESEFRQRACALGLNARCGPLRNPAAR